MAVAVTPRMEEAAAALTHFIGFGLAVAALPIMIADAVEVGSAAAVVACSIYGTALILVYLSSTLVHSVQTPAAHRLFDYMDHCSIYLLIAGTNTPFAMLLLPPAEGWSLFGIIWALALAGIVFKTIAFRSTHPDRYDKISVILYIAMGWFGFIYAGGLLINELEAAGLWYLLIGGLFYTGGTIFYLWRSLPFSHAIWHLCALAGSIFHFFAILLYVVPFS